MSLTVKVSATLSGQALAQAQVVIDDAPVGVTNADGMLTTPLQKMRNTTTPITVSYKTADMQAKSWSGEIYIAGTEKRSGGIYEVNAVLQPFIIFEAKCGDKLLEHAVISQGKQELGKTNSKGLFEFAFKEWPENMTEVSISRSGYMPTTLAVINKSGSTFSANLIEQAVLRITAVTETNELVTPLKNIDVYLNETLLGKTDNRGIFTYLHTGIHGGSAVLNFIAGNQIPEKREENVTLKGPLSFELQYLPANAPPLRTGVFTFSDTSESGGSASLAVDARQQFASNFFRASQAFQEIPQDVLTHIINASGMDIDKLLTDGWENSGLRDDLDLLIVGNVANDVSGKLLDVRFYRFDGKLLFGHLARMDGGTSRDITKAVVEIIGNVRKRFPFEGAVVSMDVSGIKVNLMGNAFPLAENDMFTVHSIIKDAHGEVTGSRTVGALALRYTNNNQPVLVENNVKPGDKIKIGDKITRIDTSMQTYRSYLALNVNSSEGGRMSPLENVNVFVDGIWTGQTKRDGTLNVPAQRGADAWLVLQRPGYLPLSARVMPKIPGEKITLEMTPAKSNFVIDSEPAGATILVDGAKVGTTPLTNPIALASGFHSLELQAPEGYVAWRQIVTAGKPNIDLTGNAKILLPSDILGIARKQQQAKKIDDAIITLQASTPDHPDYIALRYLLAELFLVDKKDPTAAIKEIERTLSVKRIDQTLNRQHNDIYVLLGRAYNSQAETLVAENPAAAALSYMKATDALLWARDHARFIDELKRMGMTHDAYYYLALAYHQIQKLRPSSTSREKAQVAWQEYFDFFPSKLNNDDSYAKRKVEAEKFRDALAIPDPGVNGTTLSAN